MDAAGVDDQGNVYETPEELWEAMSRPAPRKKSKASEDESTPVWYEAAVQYWDNQAPTDDGVLGGYGFVSDIDVRDSRIFLNKAMGLVLADAKENKRTLVALDCGAGVGRVSRAFLLHHFQEVDLVEPSAHLLEAAKKDLWGPKKTSFPASHRAVGFFQQGLESFAPEPSRYDVVWVQWAMLYLKDEDAIAFLQRCAAVLRPGGMIFIKENVCNQGFIVDSEDASVTRSHAYNVELFTKRAGLKLAHTALQKDFPKQLFKVRMYALKP